MQGNPLIACIAGICQYNEDCAEDEACDRLNRICRPVCEEDTCADSATCIGQQHQPKCHCPPGTTGSPYIECHGEKVSQPGCRTDSDCSNQLACINQLCINPCAKSDVCSAEQECKVLDTLPLRTVLCQCPTDTIADNNGLCQPIKHPQPACSVDSDCNDSDRCLRGNCIESCKIDNCGVNAQCRAHNHQSTCTCAPGYTGNAHVECTNSTFPIYL